MPFAVDPELLLAVPHRPPILRVHRVDHLAADTAVVFGSEPAGAGALPWAMGAIEGLAQCAAVLLAHGEAPTSKARPRRGMLVAVRRFVVDGEPPAGAEIRYQVQLVRRLGPTALLSGRAESAGLCLASGDLTLWIDRVGD